MQLTWLGIVIAATVAYHIVMKLTPAGVNPYLSLAVNYAVVTVAFAAVYAALPGPAPLRAAFGELNWTAAVLGVVVVFLDLGFLMLYRAHARQRRRHRAVHRRAVAHQPSMNGFRMRPVPVC